MVATFESDDGLASGLVEPVGGDLAWLGGHDATLGEAWEVVVLPPRKDLRAALPTVGRYAQLAFGEGLVFRVADGIRTRDPQIHNLVR